MGSLSLPNGRRTYVSGRSREDVRRKLDEVQSSRDAGTFSDGGGLSLGAYLDQWLDQVVKPSVRPWTYLGYEVNVRLHIKPSLGNRPLDRVTPMDVQGLMNRKTREGLSPKSVRHIRATLRAALNQAIKWDLLTRNAATRVEPPRLVPYEIRPFTPEEARQFLDHIRGDRLEALYSVALTMGLRQGEALGLRWRDIDLDRGHLRVTNQLQRVDSRLVLVEPKTRGSRRTIVMPASIGVALRVHRQRQLLERDRAGKSWTDEELVFSTPSGGPLEGTTVTRRFHELLDQAGLPQRRFHDLRHSCATLLLVQGVSPKVVQELLGHSDIAMTMNTYSHVIPELRRDAADRMDDLLNDRDR